LLLLLLLLLDLPVGLLQDFSLRLKLGGERQHPCLVVLGANRSRHPSRALGGLALFLCLNATVHVKKRAANRFSCVNPATL